METNKMKMCEVSLCKLLSHISMFWNLIHKRFSNSIVNFQKKKKKKISIKTCLAVKFKQKIEFGWETTKYCKVKVTGIGVLELDFYSLSLLGNQIYADNLKTF